MKNQLRISSVIHQMLRLPYWQDLVGTAINRPTLANHESVHRPFWARLLAQSTVVEDGGALANDPVTADSLQVSNRASLSAIPEDAPMQHLFLLDMKIGR